MGCAAISGPPAAPSRAETRVRAITCRRRGRHAVPRGPAGPRRRGERRPAISFISERQLTYTDWLPAAKCQLNCKCLAEPGREGCLFPEGAVRSRLFAPCSDAIESISPSTSHRKILIPSWKAFALGSGRGGALDSRTEEAQAFPNPGPRPFGEALLARCHREGRGGGGPWKSLKDLSMRLTPGATLGKSLPALLRPGFLRRPGCLKEMAVGVACLGMRREHDLAKLLRFTWRLLCTESFMRTVHSPQL